MTQTRVSGVGMCGRAGSWQRLVRWRVGSVRCWAFGLGVDLGVYAPSGERFVGYVALRRALEAAVARELEARRREEAARRRAEQERAEAEAARQRAEQLAQKLRELGINPDEV
jgi:hypothetical protein